MLDYIQKNRLSVSMLLAVFVVLGLMLGAVSNAAQSSVGFDVDAGSNSSINQVDDTSAAGGSFAQFFKEEIVIEPPVEPPVGGSCTKYVSTSGNDGANGTSSGAAWKTPNTAVSRANAGDVVCFAPGNYGGIDIANKNGNATNPITFRASDSNNKPVFSLGGLLNGGSKGAIYINQSNYIEVIDFAATNSMRGMYVDSSSNVLVEGCKINRVGQEGMHIGKGVNQSAPVSSNITVRGCEIFNTGARSGVDTSQNLAYSVFGEMIYVGFGSGTDASHDVLIENNTLRDNAPATAEAVNVKSGTYNITVRNNHIYNVDSWCEGAIRVNNSNNLKVIGNVIHDITASGTGGSGNACSEAHGVRFNATNPIIEDNIVWNAGKYGIYSDSGSGGTVKNNTVFYTGQRDYEKRGGSSFSSNISQDGSNGSTTRQASDFVGPLTGTADAGQGPGSGFKLKSPNGSGSQKY